MRTYSLIILIGILGYILNVKDIPKFDINEIELFKEYVLNNTADYSSYLFRMKSKKNVDMNIQLKIYHEIDLNFYIQSFSKYPDDYDIYDGVFTSLSPYSKKNDSFYNVYSFTFLTPYNSDYLIININSSYNFSIHSIYVSYKSDLSIDIYDISPKKEYELNSTYLNNKEGIYLFKLKTKKSHNGTMKLKINKEAYPDRTMIVNILGYKEEPIIEEDFNYYIEKKELLLDSKITDDKYSTYGYLYDKIEDASYLIFDIFIDKNMTYFSIYVNPNESDEDSEEENNQTNNNTENSESNPLSILFINLGIAFAIACLYFILKKCDCF